MSKFVVILSWIFLGSSDFLCSISTPLWEMLEEIAYSSSIMSSLAHTHTHTQGNFGDCESISPV
jgi:hypothetical protein